MKKTHFFLLGILLVFLSLVSYRATFALFSGTASSTANLFTASSEFPLTPPISPTAVPGANPGDVVINEVFEATSSAEEWVELFNKTGSPIDLNGWSIADNNSSDLIGGISVIPAGGYAVIVSSPSSVSVPVGVLKIQLSNAIGNGFSMASDSATIRNSALTVIDQMSFGADFTAFSPPVVAPLSNQSLSRIPNGVDTDSAPDWLRDATPTIGIVNTL